MTDVGWCYTNSCYDVIGFEIDKLKPYPGDHNYCPVVMEQFKNTYVFKSPWTIKLRFNGLVNGEASIELLKGSTIRDEVFDRVIKIKPSIGWSDPNIPRLQFHLGVVFVTDTKETELEMLPPFLEYRPERYPVITSSIKMNIYNWIKELQLGYDWMDTNKDIIIKRGDVLSYIRFNKNVKLKNIEFTDNLEKEIHKNIMGVKMMNHITDELMKISGLKRRKKWLSGKN